MIRISTNTERFHAIDAIRGFAVLGIFLVNWPSMVGVETLDSSRVYTGGNAFLRLLYDLFIQTKFYTIFAFLFGLSFFLFMERLSKKVSKPRIVFFRRLVLLFLFGSLHYILLWSGDILHSYASAGVLLLFFYHRQAKTILIWSLILLFCFQVLMFFASLSMASLASTVNEISGRNPFDQWTEQLLERRVRFLGDNLLNNVFYIPETLGMFLLGLFAGKIRLLQHVKDWDQSLQKLQLLAFIFTLPSWYMIIRYFMESETYQSAHVYFYILLSGKTLCVFYVVTILRLMQQHKYEQLLQPLTYVGKMAFTNYLLQTIGTVMIFGTFVPNSPQLPLLVGLLYCTVFYFIQVLWSKWWLTCFRYGPFEYIWRLGTYGKAALQQQYKKSPE